MEEQKFKSLKFDIETTENTIIRGVIYLEKPSFNYLEKLKEKDSKEEIKKLKILRTKICENIRLNKQDVKIDEKKYKLWTSRRIILRHKNEIKDLKLIPAIIELEPTPEGLELEREFV
ncbi:hypothetical protein J4216_00370 [Candidatus Woesearchaeota archaeon]|nr:hypothetical protein [Candidatus Woesearchaeota archaeon]